MNDNDVAGTDLVLDNLITTESRRLDELGHELCTTNKFYQDIARLATHPMIRQVIDRYDTDVDRAVFVRVLLATVGVITKIEHSAKSNPNHSVRSFIDPDGGVNNFAVIGIIHQMMMNHHTRVKVLGLPESRPPTGEIAGTDGVLRLL
jgi:hypothetical protein